MAEKQENSENRPNPNKGKGRGFASMDAAKQREIASKGGKASALGNTSNRGFASMDAEKQREISRKGGRPLTETEDNRLQNNRKINILIRKTDIRKKRMRNHEIDP